MNKMVMRGGHSGDSGQGDSNGKVEGGFREYGRFRKHFQVFGRGIPGEE